MASLAVGELSAMYAQAGVMRAGASRANDHSQFTYVAIAGVQYANARAVSAQRVKNETLTITETEGETPNTAAFSVRGFTPTDGQDVVITLGSINNAEREFAGTILTDAHTNEGSPLNGKDAVNVIDYTWQLTRRTITQRWTNTSGTAIARAIIALAPGFTSLRVQEGLPVLDEFTVTNQTLAAALGNLAQRLGAYWKATYLKDVRFGTAADVSQTDPLVLTPATALLTEMVDFSVTRDLSQVITRQPVEGGGSTALTEVAPGETILPVEDEAWYNPLGGTVVSGPQRIPYTGVQTGGGGSVVGPAVAPTAPLIAAFSAGAAGGVEPGVHQYAYTWVTAAGETLPSPLTPATLGPIANPLVAPTAIVAAGPGPDPGAHTFGYTWVDANGGETVSSPASLSVTTYDVVAPTGSGTLTQRGSGSTHSGWAIGDSIYYVLTYVNGVGETTIGPATGTIVAVGSAGQPYATDVTGIPVPTDPNVVLKRLYRYRNGASAGYQTLAAAQTALADFGNLTTAGAPPGANTALMRSVTLTPGTAPSGVAFLKYYGTAVGGAQLKYAGTSATVTTVDASLGADVPISNTTMLNRVGLAGVALGPAAVTSRKIYRTAAGAAQLKLQQTIANNTVTVGVLDATTDATLGANAPTGDTSALSIVVGTVLAGSTSILTSSAATFSAIGGWAINGRQIIRYTGLSGNTLTGIPASGLGAILSTMAYGEHIDPAPALTGIAASGVGSILYTIKQGDPVNLRVVVDDLTAQAVIAGLMLPLVDDGIIEGAVIQDGRISETEARARGTAQLALRSPLAVSVGYSTRDLNAHAGRDAGVNLPIAPTSTVGTFKIQSVMSTGYLPARWPTRQVQASSVRYTLEMLLRRARGGA